MAEEKFETLLSLRAACTTRKESVSAARQQLSSGLRSIEAWEAEEKANRAPGTRGDAQSPSRWRALVKKLYGARGDVYTTDGLRDYDKWEEMQRRGGWKTP